MKIKDIQLKKMFPRNCIELASNATLDFTHSFGWSDKTDKFYDIGLKHFIEVIAANAYNQGKIDGEFRIKNGIKNLFK